MTPPTSTQLRIVHESGLRTRLVSGPRKGKDEGYGWGRVCSTEGCSTKLHHRNNLKNCEACQLKERRATE